MKIETGNSYPATDLLFSLFTLGFRQLRLHKVNHLFLLLDLGLIGFLCIEVGLDIELSLLDFCLGISNYFLQACIFFL